MGVQEAESEVSKWQAVRDPSGQGEYYYNPETSLTMWETPKEAVYPLYRIKLDALGKLIDGNYVNSLYALDSNNEEPWGDDHGTTTPRATATPRESSVQATANESDGS